MAGRTTGTTPPEPYRIEVSDAELDDLRSRLRGARWPDQIPGSGWTYGADLAVVRDLADYWADGYDWRHHEAELNAFPQFTATIDGQLIHFFHVRSPHPEATPLILTHGWPGSVSEFTGLIEPLTDPGKHGGEPADAFHVVIPSIPGYGFSGPTTEAGWDARRTASAFAELMALLGYDRYGAQGGDWGSMITRQMADVDPEHLTGIHVNLMMAMPPGEPDDMAGLSERETAAMARMQDYLTTGNGYVSIQSTKPQTLAYGLVDSPVGLLAWIIEKFWAWTDTDGSILDAVSRDELLTNVSIYWFTGTGGSSARMYYESMASGAVSPPPTKRVPLGVANFPKELLFTRKQWVERGSDLVHWTEFDHGGHFAALETPDVLIDDIRTFFRGRRA